jgi:four helix bundle protein
MFKFENLQVWQKSIELIKKIDEHLKGLPKKEEYSLAEQLRRAILSISTNIAEGSGRNSKKEALYFYNIAKGSVYETVSLLRVMREKGYLSEEDYRSDYEDCEEIAKMLSGLMR